MGPSAHFGGHAAVSHGNWATGQLNWEIQAHARDGVGKTPAGPHRGELRPPTAGCGPSR